MSESRRFKCFIPTCPNSVVKTRHKVFVYLNQHLKRKWCKEVNIVFNPRQDLYCCEDHLNLKEDLENYYEWKLMNARPKLKKTATLKYSSENVCHDNLLLRNTENEPPTEIQIESRQESPSELKKLLLQPIENIPSKTLQKDNSITSTIFTCVGPMKIDVAVQCEVVKMVDKSTLVRKKSVRKYKPSIPNLSEESTPNASASSSLYGSTLDTDSSDSDNKVPSGEKKNRLEFIELINKNTKMYLGIPKQYRWLIQHISKQMSVTELDILITLVKIKLNDSMMRLANEFELSMPSVTLSFYRGITALASYFQNFVFMPTPLLIKQNLPMVFKIRYSNVQCILDAFEIEIEKPSDPQTQAQSWSQYKHCNTIKYLVGCTPNGFISYVSKGYGGRISDKALVEKCDLLDILPTNAVVMADRGFKEIESLLATKNIKLLRPPSVYSSIKPTKEEVLQTKVIASLRVHVERVIRRIREFKFLKPHSVVSNKHVAYLDEIVLIASGIINLQNEIIKR